MSDDPTLRRKPSGRGYRIARWIGGLGLLVGAPALFVFGGDGPRIWSVVLTMWFAIVWALGFVGGTSTAASRQDLMSVFAMTKGGR